MTHYDVLVTDHYIPADSCTLASFDSKEDAEKFIQQKKASGLYSARLFFEIITGEGPAIPLPWQQIITQGEPNNA
jgi:hypothetical protein